MGGEARAGFGCLPRLRTLMGLVRPIAPKVTIAPKLPTNRRFMHAQDSGHLGLVLPGYHQDLDLILLLSG